MPFNGSGSFSPPGANYPAVANTTATAANRNAVDADFATGLSNVICKDGQQTVTADIPFNDNKLTGVKLATDSADAMTLANFQAQTGVYVSTVGGTADDVTLTPSPAITAYAAGQRFSFIASGANTGATTVDVSALGTKSVTKNGATALAANDILSAQLVTIEYDGTQFQVIGRVDSALYLKVADLLDEDDMSSDSATQPASQQSIKAYADAKTTIARKTSDESVTSSTALQDDDDLSFAVAANEEWVAEFYGWFEGDISGSGFKTAINGPAGATIVFISTILESTTASGTTGKSEVLDTAINHSASGGGITSAGWKATLWVLNGANAGTMQLRWAQQASDTDALSLIAGSYMVAHKIF